MIATPTLFACEQAEKTSDDYYTPKWVFDTLGIEFDLDVCAPPGGSPYVPARRYFSLADDGLAQDWGGVLWMNPPFSRPAPWTQRFIEHGNGVALLPFSKSRWFFEMWDAAEGIATAGIELSKFVGGPIFMPCCLVAFGEVGMNAIAKIGRVR